MSKDSRGNELSTLPILNGVNSIADAKLFIGFESGGQARWWVRQLAQYKVPIVAGVVTVFATELEPYVQSKQLASLIAGLRGAAEYELLMGKPGAGVAGMDAQSAGHMLIILFVLLCNVSMLAGKQSTKKEGV